MSQLNYIFLRYITVYFISCKFRLARSVSIVISTIFLGSVVITLVVWTLSNRSILQIKHRIFNMLCHDLKDSSRQEREKGKGQKMTLEDKTWQHHHLQTKKRVQIKCVVIFETNTKYQHNFEKLFSTEIELDRNDEHFPPLHSEIIPLISM